MVAVWLAAARRSSLTVLSALYRFSGVGLRRVLLVGVLASLVLAGCGGSSHKTSTAATGAPATTGSTATTANTSASSIASRVLTSNELNGFTGSQPSVHNTVSGWLADRQTPSNQVASETTRLTRLGFVAGATENLTGPSGDGVSIVEQFKTPSGARSELANEVKVFKAEAAGYKAFPVTGIPGALGLAATGAGGVNIAFTSGDYYYLVGAFVSTVSASSEATMITAAKRLYRRVHG
jgi:hypothetical protein